MLQQYAFALPLSLDDLWRRTLVHLKLPVKTFGSEQKLDAAPTLAKAADHAKILTTPTIMQ